jgi:hypothetical protein
MLKRKYIGTSIEAIVKCADMVDAIHFINESGASGHSWRVEMQLREDLQKMLDRYTIVFPALNLDKHVNDILKELDDEMS